MKSFRRKSFAKISRKTLCLIMSISLCLMMVPHALYANKAYADSVPNADDSQVQPEIVKADNDMNGFGSFTYNVKDASKNSKVYTNNDLLNLLGAKVETNDSVQKSADAETKRVLLENNINLKNNVLPFAEEGAKTELTKISSVASTNAALNISPVVEEQVVDGQTVQVVNKWNFTTQNTAADNVNFPIIVTAANSTYKAVYKASIISNKVISEQVIPVNSNIATGSVKVQPASYTDKTQIYIVVDLQVKNLVNTQNNINVNVKKVNNGTYFINSYVNFDDIEFNMWTGESQLSFENLLTEEGKHIAGQIEIGYPKEGLTVEKYYEGEQQIGFHLMPTKIPPQGEKLTQILSYINEETGEEETFTINVNSVVPQKVTNVQPILDKLSAGFDMREKADQVNKIKNDLNKIKLEAQDGSSLILDCNDTIIGDDYPDIDSTEFTQINLNKNALTLIKNGKLTTNYVFQDDLILSTSIKPASSHISTKDIFVYDGNDTSKKNPINPDNFKDYWFTTNEDDHLIKLEVSDCTVCNNTLEKQKFAEFCNPVPPNTLSSEDVPINVLIKDANNIITKFETEEGHGLKLDTTEPLYSGYNLAYSKNTKDITGDNLLDWIVDAWKGIFTSDNVAVQIHASALSDIKEIYVSDNTQKSEKEARWKYIKDKPEESNIKILDGSPYYNIILSDDGEEDLKSWEIELVNGAGTKTEWYPFVTEGSEYTKIIKESKAPECTIKTDINKKQEKQIYEEDKYFDIEINDPYFYYTIQDKKETEFLRIKKVYDPSKKSKKEEVLSIKYSDFRKEKNKDIWTVSIQFTLSSEKHKVVSYEFEEDKCFNIENLLGNEATGDKLKEWESFKFEIQGLHPSVNIIWDSEKEHSEYNNQIQKCDITLMDWTNNDEKGKEIFPELKYSNSDIPDVDKIIKDWKEDEQDDYRYKGTLTFGTFKRGEDNGWWEFSISGKDKYGHDVNFGKFKDIDKKFCFDNVAPKISIDYINWDLKEGKESDDIKYFADIANPSIKVNVDEQYSWNNDDTVDVSGTCVQQEEADMTFADWGIEKYNPNKHVKYLQFNQKQGFIGDVSPDGRYNFTVEGLEDLAGNKCEFDVEKDRKDGEISTDSEGHKKFTSDTFDFDTKAPEINIDWGYDKSVYHGKYYNQARTAKVTIKERNWLNPAASENDSAKINATIDGNRIVDENANWQESGQYEHSITIPYSGQGDCALNLKCGDLITKLYQENKHHKENGVPDFVQDWTAPTINVNWDNNNVVNNMYYANARTATITIDERYFSDATNPPEIVVNPISYPGNDGVTGSYNLDGAWSNDGNLHTKTLSFPNEGAFAVEVVGNDLAMNNLNPYTQSKFVLDWTKPVINISGIENRQAYGDVAQPNVAVNDTNISDATNVNIESLGITKAMPYNGSPSTTPTTYTCTYENPEKIPDNDGVFRISVNAQDMAGNTDQQELVWSVNRFGSTYVIGADTEPMVNNYVNNDSVKDVVVTEINPSGLESSNIDLSKGTYTQTLKEGDEYTTESKGGGDSWFEQTYTVKKDTFNEDGKYSLNFYSKDKAGNTSDNTMDNRNQDRTASANVQFVLDNIKPSCNFENLDNPEYYESSHDASSLFEDNTKKFKEAKIEVDGVETYVSGDDLENNDYKIDFNIKDSSKPHTINAYATDKAGNEMEYCSKSVVVTNNPFLYWFYNTPLFIGTLVALALIIAAVVYFIYRKKKLNEE